MSLDVFVILCMLFCWVLYVYEMASLSLTHTHTANSKMSIALYDLVTSKSGHTYLIIAMFQYRSIQIFCGQLFRLRNILRGKGSDFFLFGGMSCGGEKSYRGFRWLVICKVLVV